MTFRNFIKGFGSLVEFYSPSYEDAPAVKSPKARMKESWKQVGKSFKMAVENYAQGTEEKTKKPSHSFTKESAYP